ncbi:hypothetical protein KL936_003600 [Ogataea polymorpha]|uniref:uncharacterized protein n=1 Tax=Ogataea polymorpha TaxID=460523 RepID=UPI0007F3FD35|nr:uncharacterized protein OGAPODRAFT_15905 [Ogataea polymorpha]KAG7888388.1 hypothetical protein KL936_003600 [Ogataea polymorpha]KAG7916057.1 hypothetical protein KL927_003522 [Ogataea polymorpha]KAG7935617.1 hypothetical protein KL934_002176 [Ogataea polymorpha]OBA17791.1 hypothetical protein OGAPODRAFT_15905 [Ogataea polymorpha]
MDIVIPEGEYEGDLFENHRGHAVFEAVNELRRLGYAFDDILRQSGCDRAFLEGIFQTMKIPLQERRQTKPFHTNDWVDQLVLEVSEDEEPEEAEPASSKEKQDEMHRMREYIRELESRRTPQPVPRDPKMVEMETLRKKVNSANRTALALNETIRKLDFQLKQKKTDLDKTLKEIEELEDRIEALRASTQPNEPSEVLEL